MVSATSTQKAKPITDIVYSDYSENYTISDNAGSCISIENAPYSTDWGPPNGDEGEHRNTVNKVGVGGWGG